jgi:DNA mismatch endonuclease (patch repair protein)
MRTIEPRETLVVRESTTRSMRSNRAKDTALEVGFRRALWAAGVRGYRKHVRALPGSPDLAFTSKKVVVFIHGCYWHRCPRCQKDAHFNTNAQFWHSKLAENVERDAANERKLKDIKFRVLVVWECEVKKDLAGAVRRVKEALGVDNSA